MLEISLADPLTNRLIPWIPSKISLSLSLPSSSSSQSNQSNRIYKFRESNIIWHSELIVESLTISSSRCRMMSETRKASKLRRRQDSKEIERAGKRSKGKPEDGELTDEEEFRVRLEREIEAMEELESQREEEEKRTARRRAMIQEIKEQNESFSSAGQSSAENRISGLKSLPKAEKAETLSEFQRNAEKKTGEYLEFLPRQESEDVLDMFSSSSPPAAEESKIVVEIPIGEADDAEGYYKCRIGDLLGDGRYEVFGNQGRGVFSSVLRVYDRNAGNRIMVIKVIRNNEAMRRIGQREVEVLKSFANQDLEKRRNIVRFYAEFEHQGHLCLVFESMHMNLREMGRVSGSSGVLMENLVLYSKQILRALRFLKKNNIIHADLKPDNILVDETFKRIKICDFGSSIPSSDSSPSPLLVSRFYRPPEIILGYPHGTPVDMWSFGCIIYELFTSRIAFCGADNNEMLKVHMELKGTFPRKILKKSVFAAEHFDENFQFERSQIDKVTGQSVRKKISLRVTRNLQDELVKCAGVLNQNSFKKLRQLVSLLNKCFELDPSRRITPEEALKHEFFTESL